MLIGGSLPWMFSSLAINAVNRAAGLIVDEVRRQFKLGVLEGKIPPDYRQAVAISTAAAQKATGFARVHRYRAADDHRHLPASRRWAASWAA